MAAHYYAFQNERSLNKRFKQKLKDTMQENVIEPAEMDEKRDRALFAQLSLIM